MASYNSWKLKATLNITNPSAINGFQASFTLSYLSGMAPDFHDLRFTDISGNNINYYRESFVSGVSALIWVSLPANAAQIFMYYGNAAAPDGSSINDTFVIGDEFTGTALNNAWTFDKGSVSNTNTISNDKIQFSFLQNSYCHIQRGGLPSNFIVETKIKMTAVSAIYSWAPGIQIWFKGLYLTQLMLAYQASRQFCYEDIVNGTAVSNALSGAWSDNTYYYLQFKLTASVLTLSCSSDGINYTPVYSVLRNAGQTIDTNSRLLLGTAYEATGYTNATGNNNYSSLGPAQNATYEWVRVRQYAPAQPTLKVINIKQNLSQASLISILSLTVSDQIVIHSPGISIHPTYASKSGIQFNKNLQLSTGFYLHVDPFLVSSVNLYIHNSYQSYSALPTIPNSRLYIAAEGHVLSWLSSENKNISVLGTYVIGRDFYTVENKNITIAAGFSLKDILEPENKNLYLHPHFSLKDILEPANNDFTLSAAGASIFEIFDNIPAPKRLVISAKFTYSIPIENANISIAANGAYVGEIFEVPNRDISIAATSFETPFETITVYKTLYLYPSQIQTDGFLPISANRPIVIGEPLAYVVDMGIGTGRLKIGGQAPHFSTIKYLDSYHRLSTELSKSSTDALWTLHVTFPSDEHPAEFEGINYLEQDYAGIDRMLFRGMSPDSNPVVSDFKEVQLVAYDFGWYLSQQKVPDDSLIINLQGTYTTWRDWIIHLLVGSGITPYRIVERDIPDKTFEYKGTDTKRRAIDDISAYCGCIFEVKYFNDGNEETPNWNTGAFWIQPQHLDDNNLGLELPNPAMLNWPNEFMADLPVISSNPEAKYNSVKIRGTDGKGIYFSSLAITTMAQSGVIPCIEYYEENPDCTTQELTDTRAAELLEYYQNVPYTVSMELFRRFDLQLYQRIKFDTGFPPDLLSLTDTSRNGISHLRIISINYHSENANQSVKIKAISDSPNTIFLTQQGFGSFTGYDNTKAIAENTITENTQYPYIGIVQAVAEDGKTLTVLTEDGKTITARII